MPEKVSYIREFTTYDLISDYSCPYINGPSMLKYALADDVWIFLCPIQEIMRVKNPIGRKSNLVCPQNTVGEGSTPPTLREESYVF